MYQCRLHLTGTCCKHGKGRKVEAQSRPGEFITLWRALPSVGSCSATASVVVPVNMPTSSTVFACASRHSVAMKRPSSAPAQHSFFCRNRVLPWFHASACQTDAAVNSSVSQSRWTPLETILHCQLQAADACNYDHQVPITRAVAKVLKVEMCLANISTTQNTQILANQLLSCSQTTCAL